MGFADKIDIVWSVMSFHVVRFPVIEHVRNGDQNAHCIEPPFCSQFAFVVKTVFSGGQIPLFISSEGHLPRFSIQAAAADELVHVVLNNQTGVIVPETLAVILREAHGVTHLFQAELVGMYCFLLAFATIDILVRNSPAEDVSLGPLGYVVFVEAVVFVIAVFIFDGSFSSRQMSLSLYSSYSSSVYDC